MLSSRCAIFNGEFTAPALNYDMTCQLNPTLHVLQPAACNGFMVGISAAYRTDVVMSDHWSALILVAL